jgi:hypothetical protein
MRPSPATFLVCEKQWRRNIGRGRAGRPCSSWSHDRRQLSTRLFAFSSDVCFVRYQVCFPILSQVNPMDQSPSGEAYSVSASQEISRILWSPQVHTSPSAVPALSMMNSVETLIFCFSYVLFSLLSKNESRFIKSPVCLSVCLSVCMCVVDFNEIW